MKLKTLSLLATGLILAGAAGAEYYAGAGYGISWNGGHAWTNGKKYDYETFSGMWSLFGGTVIPTEWLDFHVEGEYIRLKAKPDKGKTRRLDTAMANLIGVIPNVDLPVQPYVGFGLGYGRWDHKFTFVKQFIGGIEYNLDQYPVGFALEYKHLSPNETGGKRSSPSKINSDTLMLKVKYLF
ncbi:MAG: hypothetical protein IKQ99_02840 [Alphaproteobacteria bacterium]|nr:hypothetical protein [Alphaproteobacteria bacterium]